MSERLIAAAERQHRMRPPGTEVPVPQVALVREAVATLGWGTMTYACDTCRFEWEVWLSIGVEGPPPLRAHGLYVASPFELSSCPAWVVRPGATPEDRQALHHLTGCSGRMRHVRFAEDRLFAPRLIPDDAPRFVVAAWDDAADLVIPEPALVRARRFHADRESSS